jgi:DNA-binding NtrC family response regulator
MPEGQIESAGATSRSGVATIFVIDDEYLIADLVKTILELEGFRIQAFTDPAVAFEAFSRSVPKPDMIVTDYVMKPFNGMELMQKCRALDPSILTLLYSGNVSEQITDLYVQKPEAFLEKPFSPQSLVEIVRRLLRER